MQYAEIRVLTYQDCNLVIIAKQTFDQLTAYKTGSASKKYFHGTFPIKTEK